MGFLGGLANFLTDNLWVLGLAIVVPVIWWSIGDRNRKQKRAQRVLKKTIQSGSHEPISLHPEIDPAKCAGCGACLKACPEGGILQMIDHKAVLVSPTLCVGHGECEKACPFDAITLVFGTKTRGVDIPRLNRHYETNVPGLYIAGELGGMGLIRNAVRQGNMATTHAIAKLEHGVKADTDILIVGAGPAGLASCLTAVAERARYLCIEQNSFGGTVYNFPRQKVVMTRPAELPIVGTMQFQNDKVTKEELLQFWKDVVRDTGIKIRNQVKFATLQKVNNVFHVETSAGRVTAQKVILCMGLRGSPRRLGIANEDTAKVAYNLADAEQYQRMNLAVVGGGNAAAEASIMLANSAYGNKVVQLVRSQTFDRCNEENQRKLKALEKKGQLQIWYNSNVTQIEKDFLNINREGQNVKVPNDYLFIYAGTEMPFNFLMSLGVAIDKKFGERRKRPRN